MIILLSLFLDEWKLQARDNLTPEQCRCCLRQSESKTSNDELIGGIPLGPDAQIPAYILRRDANENLVVVRRSLEQRSRSLDQTEKLVKRKDALIKVKAVVLPPVVIKPQMLW